MLQKHMQKKTKQRVSFIKKSNRAKYSHTGGLDAIVGVYILKNQRLSHLSYFISLVSHRS